MKSRPLLISALALCCCYGRAAIAQAPTGDESADSSVIGDRRQGSTASGIQDNSFLIEEAYTQEPGTVQNIALLRRQVRDWFVAVQQEIPIGSQGHQVSYTLPFEFLRGDGRKANGIGDVLLNYRYQALEESNIIPAFSPRLSLILPTGSERRGTGEGSFGLAAALAFSKVVSDRVTVHANVGATSLFDVQGRSPTSLFVGGSTIYAPTRDFNVLFEVLGERNEKVEDRRTEREHSVTFSPGFRYAFNFNNAQLVVGLAAPLTLTRREKPSYGGIFYISFESGFLR